MRVICNSIADFLTNLASVKSEDILEKTIWINRTTQDPNDEGMVDIITLQASAIIDTEDGGQYLLEGGEICGKDHYDGDEEKKGSDRANELLERIDDLCSANGLKTKPGVLGI